MGGVMRYCNLLRAGITWKGPEVIELWSRDNFEDDSDCSLLVGVSLSSPEYSSDNSEFVWHIWRSRGWRVVYESFYIVLLEQTERVVDIFYIIVFLDVF